jgi:hypothetical protein
MAAGPSKTRFKAAMRRITTPSLMISVAAICYEWVARDVTSWQADRLVEGENTTATPGHIRSLSDPYDREALWILVLAPVLGGEPDSPRVKPEGMLRRDMR